jgi:alkylation response protein AidB-like acyl-CoA dehydrogenase
MSISHSVPGVELMAPDTREDLVAMVAGFAAREVAPGAAARDAGAPFAHDLWTRMGELGFHGLAVGAEHGGIGADVATICAVARAFGRHGQDFGLGLSWLSSMYVTTVPILELGTAEQIARYVPGLVSGASIGSQAISEPQAGSDVGAIRTSAHQDGDGWTLSGSKIFITNAPVADVLLVLAVTDPADGRRGLSLFLLDRETPGLSIGAPMRKMGNAASPTAEVFLDGCRLGPEALLGRRGRGFYDFLSSASSERLVLTALTLGVLEACVDRATAYAREREQFGRPIAEFQAIRLKLADMRIAVEAGAGLIATAAHRLAEGGDARLEISAAKVYVSEAAVAHALQAMQVLGGYGYMREYELERLFRDVRLMTVGGGTNEIHRDMIAKLMLAEPRPAV